VTEAPGTTIPRAAGTGPRPLSSSQERLFLLDRIMPGLGVYNVPTLVRVGTSLDAEMLRQAFSAIVARHEILRTSIILRDGEPVSEVMSRTDVDLIVADLRDSPEELRQSEAERLLGEVVGRPFDLNGDVLLRAALVHVAADSDLLLVVFHHAASDHRASGVLFAELERIYDALRRGEEPDLPELPIQYADFAEWQRRQLTGLHLDELVEYWRDRLAGAPGRLDLPTDRPRPAAQSYRGRLREFTLDPELADRLKELARSRRVSLFMVLLAAFNTLLHRYTGEEDVVVGAPVSGRHHDELEPLLGYFSNTLALRCDLAGDPTFAELLQQVRTTTLEAQAFQDLPFERLVEAVNPERAQSYSPIFQVLFGFDVAPPAPPTLAGRVLERQPVPGWKWSRFDLSIVCREVHGGGLRADVEWATDLFDEATVERLVGHFETLLRAVADNPDRRLSELPLLTKAEVEERVQWNATAAGYDARPIHELIGDQVARTPDAVAIVGVEDRVTYAELDRRSNSLARHLLELGVNRGDLVGVVLDRTVDLLVALLAIHKTGCAYVPIDPSYPPQRQELILKDADAQVFLTHERYAGNAYRHGRRVVCLGRDAAAIEAHGDASIDVTVSPDDLAYVIYTSGSTGKPKGVEISHRSVANLVGYMRSQPGMSANDVVANVTTAAFDLSVPDWFLTLSTGARLVLIPREATLDGVDLADRLARVNATWLQATPTTLQMLIDAGWQGSSALKIVCGGEALPRALVPQLLSRGKEVWNAYGPTETTVWSSVVRLTKGNLGFTPIGAPMANTAFHVLNPYRQPVPDGVPGELYIGGHGVARGYHKQPELTAEKFVESAFGRGRLYRTGDLVRRYRNGTLEFLERIDQQVKLRGFRIELGEIEAALAEQPGVASAVATVREDAPGDRRLVAYIVQAPGDGVEIEHLRRALKAKLPPFMVPSSFVTLDAMPVTSNGKLDRGALPAPDGSRADRGASYAPPSGPVEEALTAIWADVLRVDRVGVDDDFFDLGGHSLLALKMFAQLHETLGVSLPLARLFDASTIRSLADDVTTDLLGDASADGLSALLAEVESTAEA
jgi:amino acid adenylation domain-containing protein